MQSLTPLSALRVLVLALITATPTRGEQAKKYTDVITSIHLRSQVKPAGFTFGIVTPQKPTTDFVGQIVAPLADGVGWGGVSFGNFMIGPLLVVTWADGDKVMTAGRVANDYSVAGVVPYTANPITISPIKQGTFVNSTHISSTFLCAGCINSDSFDPSPNGDVFFGYAYSQTPVEDPSDIDTALSDHTGNGAGYGEFRVMLDDSRSADYDQYAEMAGSGTDGSGTDGSGTDGIEPEQPPSSTPTPTPTSTASPSPTLVPPAVTSETDDGCWDDVCVTPEGPDYSHREIPLVELIALAVVGMVYVVRASMS